MKSDAIFGDSHQAIAKQGLVWREDSVWRLYLTKFGDGEAPVGDKLPGPIAIRT